MKLPREREREPVRPSTNPTRTRGGAAKSKLPPDDSDLARAERLALRAAARAPVPRRTTRGPATARSTPARSTAASPPPRQPWLPFGGGGSGRARLRPELLTRRLLHVGMAVLALLLLFGAGMVVYQLSSGFRLFALQKIDVRGAQLLTREEIEATVRELLQEGVLRADLDQIRQRLRRQELIEDVEVTRLLPDTIRLVVRERVPVALVRRTDGSIVCVDRNGVLFGRASLYKQRPLPPLITGLREPDAPAAEAANRPLAPVAAEPLGADAPLTPLTEGALASTEASSQDPSGFNRRCVETYLRLLAELDQGFPALSTRLDEVQFDEFDEVRVILSESRTIVYLGREDYRQRLNAALDVLDAVARRDLETLQLLRLDDAERLLAGARIAYLNTKVPRRIVVGLSN